MRELSLAHIDINSSLQRNGSSGTHGCLTSVTPSSSDRYPWGTKNPSSSSSSSPSSSSSCKEMGQNLHCQVQVGPDFCSSAGPSPLHYGRGFPLAPPLPTPHHCPLHSPAASARNANISVHHSTKHSLGFSKLRGTKWLRNPRELGQTHSLQRGGRMQQVEVLTVSLDHGFLARIRGVLLFQVPQ